MDERIFAAHIDGDRVQSVEEHLQNTARIARCYASRLGLGSIVELACLMHDMGKLCSDFDDYIRGKSNVKRGQLDHAYAGAKYVLSLAGEGERVAAVFVARVIVSHHGLHDWLTEEGVDYLKERISKDEKFNKIVEEYEKKFPRENSIALLKQAEQELLTIRKSIVSICQGNREYKNMQAAFYMGMLERLAESILIDADRTDTSDFMAGITTLSPVDVTPIWDNIHNGIKAKCIEFAKNTDDISTARSDISERCAEFAHHRVGICRLIVPTGGGKTLSSMRFAADYCREHKCNRIFYTAPFMSILEQNSDVIRSLVGDDEQYLEHHSNFMQEIDDENEVKLYQYHSEKWDSAVVSTTLVQLLNTLFRAKTSCVRRFHRLCNSVIIIDEVQSLPVKCTHLFNLAMNFLSKVCGAAVVLCSATQPPFENDEKYPLLLDEQSSMTGDFTADFERFRRTRVVNKLRTEGYSYDETAQFCYEKCTENGNVLLVVNTKKAAETIYQKLKDVAEQDVMLLHISTKMCPQHRRDTLKKLRMALDEEKRVICVTTQLIEAGVDISFKCVIRSLAGLDNIAQAAGRCNRNGKFPCTDVYIINISDENLDKLNDIKRAKTAALNVLYREIDEDILSIKNLTAYYTTLFKERNRELSYKAEDISQETNLVDLFAFASKRRANVVDKSALDSKTIYQCPKTAGELFSVIESHTHSVVVPYNDEARELITQLTSEIPPQMIRTVLRKAQKYIVELYAHDERKLWDSGALHSTEYGMAVLSQEHYNNEYGVTLEGGIKEVLIF